jgi:hypothetical protein
MTQDRQLGISQDQARCEASGGVWLNGQCISKEELDCRKQGGRWEDGRCISAEEAKCKNNSGIWDNGVCIPPITASDCTNSTDGLSAGQFAVCWGALPSGTKKLNVYYKEEDKKGKIYKGIKADFPTPVIVSGLKPGVTVVWHIEAVNEWGKKVGYSNEVTTVTKS